LFAGRDATEPQLRLLVDTLVSGLVGDDKPARIVAESLQPSKMLFDKESPNLYREPLVSMQLIQRSLEQILSRPDLPTSIHKTLTSFQDDCITQVSHVQKAVEDWRHSENGHDRSPWGVSGRKPIFEVLYMLASGSGLLKSNVKHLEVIHDASKVHPVVIEASRHYEKDDTGRLFLIE
ncbi:hypothetical protein BGX26_012973, partial [Mortierella sp. AD094]